TVDICARLIDLVDRYDDFDPGGFCMADRLNCLRHNAVIRRNYEDRDIRSIGSAHTHCRKCLMSRCIQESDLLSVHRYNVCTNVLRNAAGLFVDHMCVPDRVEKRSLTMVYVS